MKKGDAVLFHAAAGGIGLIAGQWLKHIGATVIGTVSSEEKAKLARANGYDHTIIYTKENFTEESATSLGVRSQRYTILSARIPSQAPWILSVPAAS